MKVFFDLSELEGEQTEFSVSGSLAPINVRKNSSIVLPVLSVEGRQFLGWIDDLGSMWGRESDYVVTRDATLKPWFDARVVNIQPGIGMLALFKAMNYKMWFAFGEMVDNSIQSYLEHKPELLRVEGPTFRLLIEIIFDRSNESIIVRDNAAGIYSIDIPKAFTPAVRRDDLSGIGQYGIGMKSSATWFSNDYEIETKALGEPIRRRVHFDVARIIEENSNSLPVVELTAPETSHGTSIHLRSLNHGLPRGNTVGRIRSYIASIYREFIRAGEIDIFVDGTRLEFQDRPLLNETYWPNDKGPETVDSADGTKAKAPPRYWKQDFEFELADSWAEDGRKEKSPSPQKIRGWIGIQESGSPKYSGLALLWKGKVVRGAGNGAGGDEDSYRPRTIFGASNSFTFQRLIGEIDVSDLTVTAYKDNIVWTSGQEEEFQARLIDVLNEHQILRMARNYRALQTGTEVLPDIERATQGTAQAAGLAVMESLNPVGHFPQSLAGDVLFRPVEVGSDANVEARFLAYRDSDNSIAYSIEVVRDETSEDLLSLRDLGSGQRVISINRRHRFMESFANLPGADLDPILRLLVAIALTQVKLKSRQAEGWHLVIPYLNDFVASWLSNRMPNERSLGNES